MRGSAGYRLQPQPLQSAQVDCEREGFARATVYQRFWVRMANAPVLQPEVSLQPVRKL